jgi:uncharacterized protein YqhQ
MASHSSPTYGGQAVLEGVLIRGQRFACVAVRRPDGSIAQRSEPLSQVFTGPLRRLPVVRGIVILIETMSLGMRALVYSANVGAEAEGEEIGKGAMAAMLALSLLFAVGLFFMAPVLISRALEEVLGSELASNVAEGLIRLALFLAYILLIGRMEQISRVFMYHGAEHMTVHAQEHLESLDIESVRKYPTAHPRCGTAFLLTVMVVAVGVFAFVGRDPLWWLITSRIAFIPLIAALSYEAIRFIAVHSGNSLVQMLGAPSLALQALTTRQPDDDQIEVAIAAMNHALAADEGSLPPATMEV